MGYWVRTPGLLPAALESNRGQIARDCPAAAMQEAEKSKAIKAEDKARAEALEKGEVYKEKDDNVQVKKN